MKQREIYQARVERILEDVLPIQAPNYLSEAMRYSVLGGGKRIRAILVYATGEALKIKPELLDSSQLTVKYVQKIS